MSILRKAADLYLRGFNGAYIKEHTGVSVHSLLATLRSKGVRFTKADIVKYQIKYIRKRYSNEDVVHAYEIMSETYNDVYEASRGKHIEALGCGFGEYKKVFSTILGDEAYAALRNRCWKAKQTETVRSKYGVSNVFEKEVFDKFVTEDAVAKGREQRTKTLVERYGVEHPNQNSEIAMRMQNTLRLTNMDRYGVPNPMQVSDIAKMANILRQESMLRQYGFKNSVEIESIRNRIFATRAKNNTLNASLPEDTLEDMLISHFGRNDIIRNTIIDDRYPYHVDFYVKSKDLFIELNGDTCHGGRWFNPESDDDLLQLEKWRSRMVDIEKMSGKESRYRKYIKTWTETDIEKRRIAKDNNLNYLVFWDGTCRQRDGVRLANLKDAREWFDAYCPMPQCYKSSNTY